MQKKTVYLPPLGSVAGAYTITDYIQDTADTYPKYLSIQQEETDMIWKNSHTHMTHTVQMKAIYPAPCRIHYTHI